MNPYYDHKGITIYHGDCREVLPQLDPIDLVLTDPPYGIAHPTDYASRGRGLLTKCHDYPPVYGDSHPFEPEHLFRLADAMILWGANYYADKLAPKSGWLVWDKRRPPNFDQADVELAWTNCVKGARIFRHLWHGMMRASEHGENWHPTQKPVALMKWCLTLKGVPEGSILDPYMGAGPVLRAAKDLGRKCTGIEIEEKYCEIAARRLGQEVLPFGDA